MMNKSDFLIENLKFKHNWITHANNGAGILLAFYATFITIVLDKNFILASEVSCLQIILTILFGILASCTFFSFFSVLFPRIKNNNDSLIYFGSIGSDKKEDLKFKLDSLELTEINKEITEQIYTNSVIAKTKFTYLKYGILLMIFSFILLLIIMIVF